MSTIKTVSEIAIEPDMVTPTTITFQSGDSLGDTLPQCVIKINS